MPVRRESKLYQDQIYGTKVLSELAVAVLDTPEVQRLAKLRQLGFTDFAYRGATHTRLAHSVGTYFVCRTMMRRIAQNHDRLGWDHPALLGGALSSDFVHNPRNAGLPDNHNTAQAKWRGLTEVVSIAGLLHDIGHVPYGHTLEDEFTGIYEKHDGLGHSRVYSLLFDDQSQLAHVFDEPDDPADRWLRFMPNPDLRDLIYLILSWKESIDPNIDFREILAAALKAEEIGSSRHTALSRLSTTYARATTSGLFHPFMSDIVGNTVCADLFDYLPRDRFNLGMSSQGHQRLQRYLTVREGQHRMGEGLRLSILVNRRMGNGQRRDVSTSILALMRERYEMAERVYYHHRKASASSMLVKLIELMPAEARPRDDDRVYPAPWSDDYQPEPSDPPHLLHLSDDGMVEYLGRSPAVPKHERPLQRQLHQGIYHRRDKQYRTLMVLDADLLTDSCHPVSYITSKLREPAEVGNAFRLVLEAKLCAAAGAPDGSVIIYCPSQKMQAKEVDARVEISHRAVLPLRTELKSFALRMDLESLSKYYSELWRAYVFVAPSVFEDPEQCRKVVDKLVEVFELDRQAAYRKVRTHAMTSSESTTRYELAREYLTDLKYDDIPPTLVLAFLDRARADEMIVSFTDGRLDELFISTTVDHLLASASVTAAQKRSLKSAGSRLGERGLFGLVSQNREGKGSWAELADGLMASTRKP